MFLCMDELRKWRLLSLFTLCPTHSKPSVRVCCYYCCEFSKQTWGKCSPDGKTQQCKGLWTGKIIYSH